MNRNVIFTALLLALLSCTREEPSSRNEGIRFSAVGASSATTKTEYEGTEDPTEHRERINWIAGDMVRVWSNRAKAGLPPQDHSDYRVLNVTPNGLESVAEVVSVHDPLNWKSGAHLFYALYPSPLTEEMDDYITFNACDYGFEENFKITCKIPQKETLTWTDDGDLHRGYPNMHHAYLWATQSASEPTHDVIELAFHPRFTAFEFVFTSSKIDAIHLKSFTLETTDDTPLFGTFTIKNDGTVTDISSTTSSVTYTLDQTIEKNKYLSITLLALYKDISNLKITVTGDEILTRSLKLERVDGTALSFPAGKKYRFINLDFPAVFAEGEGIQWNERLQILGVGEDLDWRTLQEILAHGADMDGNVSEDTDATVGEDMKEPGTEEPGADGQDMLPDNSGETITANFTDSPAVDFTWHSEDKIAIHYNIPEASFHTYFSSSLLSGVGSSTAAFQVSKSGVRDGYALYPGTMAIEDASGIGGAPLRVTLPQSWNVDEMPMPLPMLAVSTEGADLDFKALCGVLRLSLNGIPEGTRFITLTTDNPVYGEFNVDLSGLAPELSSAVNSTSGNVLRLNFTNPVPAGGVNGVLDIPLPSGSYPSLIVKAYASSSSVRGVATNYTSPTINRAEITSLTMDMEGAGALVEFTLAQNISYMAGQATEELDFSLLQILSGGGMEEAAGYTFSVESISDPEVLMAAITTGLGGEEVIELTPLAVGNALITICASKGLVTLKASTMVTVGNISGIGFRSSYPYVPLRNAHVEEAYPVVGGAEVAGSFNYQWTIDSGNELAAIEGASNQARVRIKAGSSATGDVVLRCTIYTGGRVCATATRTVKVFQVPAGTVNGLFSIEDGSAILFSSGNLTYQKSTAQYTLQEHQWSAYSGVASSKKPTDSDEDFYDVFSYFCNSSNQVTGAMGDPFVNRNSSPAVHIGTEDTYGWFMPPRMQFQYILNGRTGAILPQIGSETGRYMLVTLTDDSQPVPHNRKDGVIVFPDCFVWPDGLDLPMRLGGGNSNCNFDTYTLDQFVTYLEPLGCLFLPGGNAAPGYDELGKENLNTTEKFYGRYFLYYDGSRGYVYSTFYNYNDTDYDFTTPTATQTISFALCNGIMPNRWFHIRVAKHYEDKYTQ